MTFVTVAGVSLKDYVVAEIQKLSAADFLVNSSGGSIDPALVKKLEDIPGVQKVTPYRLQAVTIDGKPSMISTEDGGNLADVAKLRGKSPEETAIDLVVEDHSRVGTAFFLMSEDNVRLGLSKPWIALGSDEGSYVPEGVFLKSQPHPRAYGNFARFLGHYVRDEHVDTLESAVRRLSGLPADHFRLRDRGYLKRGYYADIVVFNPATIADHATYDEPRQFATGVSDVVVNGVEIVRDGAPTGAKPGRFVTGPGYSPAAN